QGDIVVADAGLTQKISYRFKTGVFVISRSARVTRQGSRFARAVQNLWVAAECAPRLPKMVVTANWQSRLGTAPSIPCRSLVKCAASDCRPTAKSPCARVHRSSRRV